MEELKKKLQQEIAYRILSKGLLTPAPIEFDNSVQQMLSFLKVNRDAYLIGPVDFKGLFTVLGKAALSNRRADSGWAIPGEVVRRLEANGQIRRFLIKDETRVVFRA